MKVLIDSAVYSEHRNVINGHFKTGSVERSIDLETKRVYLSSSIFKFPQSNKNREILQAIFLRTFIVVPLSHSTLVKTFWRHGL
jgi:hypothetical protein